MVVSGRAREFQLHFFKPGRSRYVTGGLRCCCPHQTNRLKFGNEKLVLAGVIIIWLFASTLSNVHMAMSDACDQSYSCMFFSVASGFVLQPKSIGDSEHRSLSHHIMLYFSREFTSLSLSVSLH